MKVVLGLVLLTMAALLLSGCGPVPVNNYAGLSSDGTTLYVADQAYLFAIDPGLGTVSWKYPEKGDIANAMFAAPAVANGWVYVGTYKNELYGFRLEGLDKAKPVPTWSYKEQSGKGKFIGSPVVVGDLVVIASADGNVYALEAATGVLKWSFEGRNAFWSTPASDGKAVYVTGMDHYLYALDAAKGAKLWEIDLGGPALGNLALSANGMLYTGTLNGEMLAVKTADKKIVWRKELAGNTWAAPLLLENKLYFGTDQSKLYILDALEGSEIKVVDAGASVIAAPVYTQDAIVVVNEKGDAFSLSLDGSSKAWTRSVKGKLYSTPVVIGQQVIFSAFQGDHILGAYDFNGNSDSKWNSLTLK